MKNGSENKTIFDEQRIEQRENDKMKLLLLPREFIYKDRKSLDDFLIGDELNKKLYEV